MTKKILLMLILSFFITGCSKEYDYDIDTVNYFLNIDDLYHEQIIFTEPTNIDEIVYKERNNTGRSLETMLVKDDFSASFTDHDKYYEKDLHKLDNKYVYELKYDFTELEFLNEQNIRRCFKDFSIESKENTFTVNISGRMNCLFDKKLYINIKSSKEVIDTNGILNDDYYSWEINSSNRDNVSIIYKIRRNFDEMSKVKLSDNKKRRTQSLINKMGIGILALILVLVELFLVKYFYDKANKIGNH